MNARAARPAADEIFALWKTVFGPQRGLLGLYSALRRPESDHPNRLRDHRQRFYAYPDLAPAAADWCRRASEAGREAFYCVHLLTAERRIKENAAPVHALWAEADGEPGEDLSRAPGPTAIVESSPGKRHLFWRLMRPLPGAEAEVLNRRLAHAIGADPSGWDLSQMSRPPGTRNMKYGHKPTVRLLDLDVGALYHPREFDLALPEPPADPIPPPTAQSMVPAGASDPVDLSRLSEKMRTLAENGNRGAGRPYPTRSHADFAVAVAMFGKDYSGTEVSSVLLDPALGISEKALEQGRHAARYVARTVERALAAADPADRRLAPPRRYSPARRATGNSGRRAVPARPA